MTQIYLRLQDKLEIHSGGKERNKGEEIYTGNCQKIINMKHLRKIYKEIYYIIKISLKPFLYKRSLAVKIYINCLF